MRHYEVVFLVHPGQSEQVSSMVSRYREMVESDGGTVHRVEDWGRKKLAYPINRLHKAHYVLVNIECNQETVAKLQYSFRFNDVVLRYLVMSKKTAVTGDSAMLIAIREEKKQEEKARNRFTKVETQKQTDQPDNDAAQPEDADETAAEPTATAPEKETDTDQHTSEVQT